MIAYYQDFIEGGDTKLHLFGRVDVEPVGACGVPITEHNSYRADRITADLRCRKNGCRQKWADVETPMTESNHYDALP